MSGNDKGTDKKTRLTFTLVHGTFALGADWVTNDSDAEAFRSKLRAELEPDYEVRFEVVPWGHEGRFARLRDNTIARRLHGIQQLKQHLLACADVSPTDQRFIVAHSHGGNIVLCTLNLPEQDELLRKVTGVVCLASPFLRYRFEAFHRGLLFISAAILLIFAFDHQQIALWIYTAFYLAIVAVILVTRNFGETEASLEKIAERRQKLTLVDRQPFMGPPGARSFLAIRPRRDEVAILFWLTWGLGGLFRRLWMFLNKIGEWLIGLFILTGLAIGALEELPIALETQDIQNLRSLADQFVMTPLLLITTVILSGMVVMRWSYAFDALPWIPRIGVTPEILPWQGAKKEVLKPGGLVKHTGIQNQSPPAIATWIRSLQEAEGVKREN